MQLNFTTQLIFWLLTHIMLLKPDAIEFTTKLIFWLLTHIMLLKPDAIEIYHAINLLAFGTYNVTKARYN